MYRPALPRFRIVRRTLPPGVGRFLRLPREISCASVAGLACPARVSMVSRLMMRTGMAEVSAQARAAAEHLQVRHSTHRRAPWALQAR